MDQEVQDQAAKNLGNAAGELKTEQDSDDEWLNGCGYQGYEFGAGTYPDSLCVEGRLFDADDCDDQGRLYEPIEDIPCPVCAPADAIDYWTKRNQLSGAPRRTARAAAKSLVADILENRGKMAEA